MTAETPANRPNLMHLGRPAGEGCGCGGECMCGGHGKGGHGHDHGEHGHGDHGHGGHGLTRIRTEDAARAQAAMQEDAQ